MSINGIGASGYPVAGYTTKRTQQNKAGRSFAESVNNVAGSGIGNYGMYPASNTME